MYATPQLPAPLEYNLTVMGVGRNDQLMLIRGFKGWNTSIESVDYDEKTGTLVITPKLTHIDPEKWDMKMEALSDDVETAIMLKAKTNRSHYDQRYQNMTGSLGARS